jgi:hypothetical protein
LGNRRFQRWPGGSSLVRALRRLGCSDCNACGINLIIECRFGMVCPPFCLGSSNSASRRPFKPASNDFSMAAVCFRRFERTLPALSLVWSNGGPGSKQGRIRPVGAGDGGTPKVGAVEVCGSPNPIEVAEWLPSNLWSAWRTTILGRWDGWGVLLAATLFGLVAVLGTWRSPRRISTKNGRVGFRIYGFHLCLFAESVCGGGRRGNLDQSSERMLEAAGNSIILSPNKSYPPL